MSQKPQTSEATPLPLTAPAVYACIARVSADLAHAGIGKARTNAQQGYRFRGIDDVYNALAPMLAKHGLVILPRVLSRDVVERTTQKGAALFYVTVAVEFDFIAAVDGSRHTVKTYGEAMDSADKATNKAMSAAYKYAAFQTFCIPTEGDNDADATTHSDVAAAAPQPPAGFPDWLIDLECVAEEGHDALKATWAKSDPKLRKHLLDTDKDRWEAIKARAAQHTAVPA